MENFITPQWPAPHNVHAYTTTRHGGCSLSPYDSMNVSTTVGDNATHVQANRQQLCDTLGLPSVPIWLKQVHSTLALLADTTAQDTQADATYTTTPDVICVVQAADCLPVLLCDQQGNAIAAIHAGWRGLAQGIIEETIRAMGAAPQHLMAWLGPAIGSQAFEVGPDVRSLFLENDPAAQLAFLPHGKEKWKGNMVQLAKQRLIKTGIQSIYGGNYCTFTDEERFFSARRNGLETGRMASLIWLSA